MSRIAAWSVLRSGHPAPMRLVDRAAEERELDERDTALVRRLVGSEVRHRGTLRALVRAFTNKKLKPDLLAHLHLGIAQLLYFDRIPDHAAVSETCGAVADTLGRSKVPLVNGVLRSVIRARREGHSGDPRRDVVGRELYLDRDVFHDPREHPLLWAEDALSIPAALMKRWTRRLGREGAEALARFFLTEPDLVLRVVRGEREALFAELLGLDVPARAGVSPDAIVCPADATGAVTASQAFREGRVTIQGETAARAAQAVGARRGERLLDLCAGPGGKTAILAGSGASVVACDVDPERLALVASTCARLGVGERVALVASDGTAALAEESFDGVLVDAPCSNTGVLGARPSARWRFGPANLASLRELQARLLREGAERVRPGGRLVWSTCSLEPEENERQVYAFLEESPGWALASEELALPDPGRGPLDGGYAARLVRSG